MDDLIIDARGYFWWGDDCLPKESFASPNAVTGALTVSASGQIRLSLDIQLSRGPNIGPFDLLVSDGFGDRTIHGVLIGTDRYVCLTGIQPSNIFSNSHGPSTEVINASLCFISEEIFPENWIPLANSITFPLKGYEEWIGLSAIKLKKTRHSLRVQYRKPKNFTWNISFGKLGLDFNLIHSWSASSSKLIIEEFASINIKLDHWCKVEQVIKIASRLDDLMILLTNSNRGIEYPKFSQKGMKFPIKLYYRRLKGTGEKISRVDLWTVFPNLSNHFGTIFERWYSKHETYGPGFHLYLGNRRRTDIYSEHRFASLIWGLESLHRQLRPPKENINLNLKIERILENVSKSDRRWLARALKKGSDEPPLEQRISDIFFRLPIAFKKSEILTFSKRCADRRNDISHYGGRRQPESYDEFLNDITKISAAVELLYHLFILKEIGVPEEQLSNSFLKGFRSSTYRETLRLVGLTPVEP